MKKLQKSKLIIGSYVAGKEIKVKKIHSKIVDTEPRKVLKRVF